MNTIKKTGSRKDPEVTIRINVIDEFSGTNN